MSIKIEIVGSTPLEVLATLAAVGKYCLNIPAVVTAADDMLDTDKTVNSDVPIGAAVPSSPRASVPVPASGYQPNPGMNTPPAGTVPAAQPAAAVSPAQTTRPAIRPTSGVPGGAPVNPTMPGANMQAGLPVTGPKSTMTMPTSPSNQQQYIPGMAPVSNPMPGPGAGPLPVSSAPGFTVAQVSRAGADLVTADPAKRAAVNTLLQQYGVQTLNELKPEQLGPFALALRGMGANI